MKFERICRVCLTEKSAMNPIFQACISSMIMSCSSVQIIEGDGLPYQICMQCLQKLNQAFSFKQQCEKSEMVLREYLNTLELQSVTLDGSNIISEVKTDQFFASSEVLQQSSIFQDIFNDATSHSLADTFTNQNASTVVSDLAETMQSLQTIAEQCLPETWESDTQLMSCHSNSQETCSTLNLNNLYKCQYCEGMFKDEWILTEHMKIHIGLHKYVCTICGKECPNQALLDEHLLHHSLQTTEAQIKIKNHCCELCERTFSEAKSLQKHLKDIHFYNTFENKPTNDVSVDNDKKCVCRICGKRYRLNKSLTIHMRTHTGERPLKCDICDKTFAIPGSLYKHRNLHDLNKYFECKICDKRFNRSYNLVEHMRTHTGSKPHTCSICSKHFSSAKNLVNHIKTHTGEKPFKCLQCISSFATNGQLKKHVMCHTGQTPYPCWQCGKSFRRKETRDTHMRYHTGERPYQCNLCSKKYIAASHLRVHKKSHNNEKIPSCNICTKTFPDVRTLKSHMIIHTGQKPYSCELCGHQFTQLGSLSAHVKNIHTFMSSIK